MTTTTKTHHSQRTIYVLFLIMVIDWMGYGIITPVLQEVFYHTPMFDSIPPAWRTIALGLVFAIYGVIAFFSAPVMGRLSDKFGRKRMLMFTIAGTAISNVIAAFSVVTANYWLLVLARGFDGLTTGNSSIARAAVADSSLPEHKTKNFGFMGLAGSVGFVIDPLLGGLLSDSHLVSWFTTSTPPLSDDVSTFSCGRNFSTSRKLYEATRMRIAPNQYFFFFCDQEDCCFCSL
jgi:MFS family permease